MNSIELQQLYIPLLDKKYAVESKTSFLDADPSLVDKTLEGNAIKIPKMVLSGLGDYKRNDANAYATGSNTLTWETHTFTQDRGNKFVIDTQDNIETAGVAFGSLASEFIRTKVAPELDAYRFSKYLDKAGTVEEGVLTAENVMAAIDAAIAEMDDKEVPEDDRVLFVSVKVYNLMKSSEAIQRRFDVNTNNGNVDRRIELLDGIIPIVKVPGPRFYAEYDFHDGREAGEEAGGFVPVDEPDKINFLLVSRSAILQIVKSVVPKIILPEVNQTSDGFVFMYRIYHDCFVPDNKTDGIYGHIEPYES